MRQLKPQPPPPPPSTPSPAMDTRASCLKLACNAVAPLRLLMIARIMLRNSRPLYNHAHAHITTANNTATIQTCIHKGRGRGRGTHADTYFRAIQKDSIFFTAVCTPIDVNASHRHRMTGQEGGASGFTQQHTLSSPHRRCAVCGRRPQPPLSCPWCQRRHTCACARVGAGGACMSESVRDSCTSRGARGARHTRVPRTR